MNRVFRLLGIVLAFIWLHGGVSEVGTLFGREPRGIGDFTEPYWTCSGRTCVMNEGCGENTCEWDPDCGGCDPAAEAACINQGWNWDPNACQCSQPPCDSGQRDWCAGEWGTWHEDGCWCDNPCLASPDLVSTGGTGGGTPVSCQDCCTREYMVTMYDHYVQYCRDYRIWWEFTSEYSYYEYYPDPSCVWQFSPYCPQFYPDPYWDCLW
jgi:hypothetical protein